MNDNALRTQRLANSILGRYSKELRREIVLQLLLHARQAGVSLVVTSHDIAAILEPEHRKELGR